MGVEYALVHDETCEAFDLGKGPWSELVIDGVVSVSTESLIRLLKEWLIDEPGNEDVLPLWAFEAIARILAFLESHPGSRLINDCSSDDWWSETRPSPEEIRNNYGARFYLQVGSRYV